MKRKRHSAEQIISKLREAEALLQKGQAVPQVCRQLGVTAQTYYRWWKEYGGMRADQAKRLKDLEKENTQLKKIVADQAPDMAILKDVRSWSSAGDMNTTRSGRTVRSAIDLRHARLLSRKLRWE